MKISNMVFLFFFNPFVACGQNYTRCDIYQYQSDDSANMRKICEEKFNEKKLLSEHHFGTNIRYCTRISFQENIFPKEKYYYYSDTVLTKEIYVNDEKDTTKVYYSYNQYGELTATKTYSTPSKKGGNLDVNYELEVFEYNENKEMYRSYKVFVTPTDSQRYYTISFCYHKYDQIGRVILDSNIEGNTPPLDDNKVDKSTGRKLLTADELIDKSLDTVAISFNGRQYYSRIKDTKNYHYFNGGYATITNLNVGTNSLEIDSFFYNESKLIVKHISGNQSSLKNKGVTKKTEEHFYYDDQGRIVKAKSQCFDLYYANERYANKITWVYKYYTAN